MTHVPASKFLNIAHRGASAVAPENTLSAFRAAIEAGATAIEMDLRVTRDGHVVVMHDRHVNRTTNGAGLVRQLTLDQLKELDAGSSFDHRFAGEKVPTLQDVFAAIPAPLVLHIKEADVGIEERVIKLARQYQAIDRIVVSSRLHRVLVKAKVLQPEIQTTFVSYCWSWRPWMRWVAFRAKQLSVDRIALKGALVTPAMLRYFKGQGLLVRAWGVNCDEAIAVRLIRMGVDGLSFDHPARLWEIWGDDSDARG